MRGRIRLTLIGLEPEDIDLRDERFRIRPTGPVEDLAASIREVGLAQPPLLVRREGRPVVLSGWRRIRACKQADVESVPTLFLDNSDDLAAFRLAVCDNLAVRDFSPAEIADIMRKLRDFGENDETLIRGWLPRLGIPSTRRHLEGYLHFAGFEEGTRHLIHRLRPDFATLTIMAALSRDERDRLRPFLESLGRNRMKELLTDLFELSRISEKSAGRILDDEDEGPQGEEARRGYRERAEHLRRRLKELRFPEQSGLRKRWDSLFEESGLPADVRLDPGLDFEEESLTLKFSFVSRKEFEEKLRALGRAADGPLGREMFRFDEDD